MLFGFTVLVFLLTLRLGFYPISLSTIAQILFGERTSDWRASIVVLVLRLPRALIGWMVGAAFGMAGAIVQALTRNPIAEPGILGINAGAGVSVVSIMIFWPTASHGLLPGAAFTGALLTAALVYLLSTLTRMTALRLILNGVAISAVFSAATSTVLIFGKTYDVDQAMIWLVGGLSGRSWPEFWQLLPWLLVLAPLAITMGRILDVLEMGDEVAGSLGSRVTFERAAFLVIGAALAGASVAVAGPIGFVGLLAPNAARLVVRDSHRSILQVSAMLGGLLVMTADLVSRVVIAPREIPCGLVTAIVGAPFLLLLLVRRARSGMTR